MMKVKRSRRSDIFENNATETNKVSLNKKSERRKSGPFRGLTLKPLFGIDSTRKASDKDPVEEKTSLLKRIGSRRSSKKKAKKTLSGSDSKSDDSESAQNKGLYRQNQSACPQTDKDCNDAGHTPKLKRIQRISSSKVYKMLDRSPWGSEESEADDTEAAVVKVKRSRSLKETGQKLKRSMSMLCAGSRSKLAQATATECVKPKMRPRRSLGTGLMDDVDKDGIVAPQVSVDEDEKNSSLASVLLDFNVRNAETTPKNSGSSEKTPSTAKRISALRRRSEGTVLLSTKKLKLKRCSYERMNHDRDCSSPTVEKIQRRSSKKDGDGSAPKRTRSLRRTWSSFKISNKKTENDPNTTCDVHQNTADKPLSHKESVRRSSRRKSIGVPSSPAERRGSGIYATANTPTFMTCGYIMTDSPPEQANDLPWVTLKRKRRGEMADNSKVNRANAGHTPLPPRKKKCSFGERLIE